MCFRNVLAFQGVVVLSIITPFCTGSVFVIRFIYSKTGIESKYAGFDLFRRKHCRAACRRLGLCSKLDGTTKVAPSLYDTPYLNPVFYPLVPQQETGSLSTTSTTTTTTTITVVGLHPVLVYFFYYRERLHVLLNSRHPLQLQRRRQRPRRMQIWRLVGKQQ